MPKITINELDYTSGGAYLANENVVYIPGFSSKETLEDALGNSLVGVPTLCTTEEEFVETFGATPRQNIATDVEDKSFVMAYELLKLGMHVLYEVPATEVGGAVAVTTLAEIEASLKLTGFWTRLKDRGLYDIRFITSGAYGKGDSAVIADMLTVASSSGRGDSVALIDHASTLTTKSDVQTFFNTSLSGSTQGKFGAGFTPWVHIASSAFVQENNLLPGSYAYLAAFALSVQTNPSWLAIAGASRGRIPGLVAPYVNITYGEIEANDLQSRDQDTITINPICNINPFGYILWGNRTLNPIGAGTVQQEDLVASNFLNIRNIIISIKKALFVTSRRLTFEQNNDVLWINFKAGIAPMLDQMVTGNGIADYRLIKKTSSVKATLKAVIRIVPIEAVEDFDLMIEMSDSVESVTE